MAPRRQVASVARTSLSRVVLRGAVSPGSSNGRTHASGACYRSSNLCPGAMALSSRGLGRRPLTAVTRVRLPLGLRQNSLFDGLFSHSMRRFAHKLAHAPCTAARFSASAKIASSRSAASAFKFPRTWVYKSAVIAVVVCTSISETTLSGVPARRELVREQSGFRGSPVRGWERRATRRRTDRRGKRADEPSGLRTRQNYPIDWASCPRVQREP